MYKTVCMVPPPMCLCVHTCVHHITACTQQNLLGLSPPFLHAVSDQKLDSGKGPRTMLHMQCMKHHTQHIARDEHTYPPTPMPLPPPEVGSIGYFSTAVLQNVIHKVEACQFHRQQGLLDTERLSDTLHNLQWRNITH